MQELNALEKEYPDAHYYLDFETPFQLVMATILSAQTMDTAVNRVTPELYERFRTPEELANADVEEIARLIAGVTYAGSKAKYLQKTGRILVEEFDGTVPERAEDLTKLPGVGKKTANAIQQNAFGIVEGIVVDTHVIRLSRRLGWTQQKDPGKIERDLMEIFPKDRWKQIPHLLKNHGRKICTARSPKCDRCVLNGTCPSAFKV